MDSLKKRADLNSQPNDGRRSFIWKMGAAMTAGVFATSVPAAVKSSAPNDLGSENGMGKLSERIARLEAEKSIIGLYHAYESLLNDGMYDKIPNCLTPRVMRFITAEYSKEGIMG